MGRELVNVSVLGGVAPKIKNILLFFLIQIIFIFLENI